MEQGAKCLLAGKNTQQSSFHIVGTPENETMASKPKLRIDNK